MNSSKNMKQKLLRPVETMNNSQLPSLHKVRRLNSLLNQLQLNHQWLLKKLLRWSKPQHQLKTIKSSKQLHHMKNHLQSKKKFQNKKWLRKKFHLHIKNQRQLKPPNQIQHQ